MAGAWSEEEVEILKREWPRQTPLREIVEMLSPRSRSSVCGAAARIGLAARAVKNVANANSVVIANRKRLARRPKSSFEATPMKPKPNIIPPPTPYLGEGVEILQLTYEHCRNIIGYRDGQIHRAVYCGAPRYNNTSYCAHHAAINHRDDRR